MKKLSYLLTFAFAIALFFSCQPEEIITNDAKSNNGTNLEVKNSAKRNNQSGDILEIKFTKYFYNLVDESIRVKVSFLDGGFGPALQLGTHVIDDGETIKIQMPYGIKINSLDRLWLEIDKISPYGNSFRYDGVAVGRQGSRKIGYNLPTNIHSIHHGTLVLSYINIVN